MVSSSELAVEDLLNQIEPIMIEAIDGGTDVRELPAEQHEVIRTLENRSAIAVQELDLL